MDIYLWGHWGGANVVSKCCCFDDVIMEVWNSHRCSWLTLYSCYGPAFPWKNVHGFQSEWFSDSVGIWSVANKYKFLFWPEFRPPATLHPRSFEAASRGRWKFLKHTHFAFIYFFWNTHSQSTTRAKQGKCASNKCPAMKLKYRIIVPDQRSNKELRRCQHFLS